MSLEDFFVLYLIAAPIFFFLDIVWLSAFARNFYRSQLGSLLTDKINWTAAIIFYLLFIAGIVIFVLIPSVVESSFQKALIFGALFGFFAYATYDLTNLATTKNWPFKLAIVDLIWGTVLSASVSSLAFLVFQNFK